MDKSNTVFSYPDEMDEKRFEDVIHRLRRPEAPVDMVLDTDTYNEVDDQYAIAYMAASRDRLRIRAITAAPFLNHHSDSPRDGMEHTPENPLYIVCIAAPVNVASALLLRPEIADRVVVVWSGGVGLHWTDCRCFNGGQNIAASRVLLESGTPLVLAPGRGVSDRLLTTGPELEHWLRGKNAFCDYIIDKTIREAEQCFGGKVWSRPLTDVVPVAWLVSGNFVLDRRRPMMRYVYYVKRDELMADLFDKLSTLKCKEESL